MTDSQTAVTCTDEDLFRCMSLVAWLRGAEREQWASLKQGEAADAIENVVATARAKRTPPPAQPDTGANASDDLANMESLLDAAHTVLATYSNKHEQRLRDTAIPYLRDVLDALAKKDAAAALVAKPPETEQPDALTPESLGFNERECGIVAEMLAEKDMSFKAAMKSALRLYQLCHKCTMAGGQFLLIKDGRQWPYTGPMLADDCENCGGSGKVFVGFSGQDVDGNAPLYEACDDCVTPTPQPDALVEGMAEALRALRRLDQSKEPAEEFRVGRQALELYDSREPPSAQPPAPAPAPVPGGWRPIGEAQTLARFILENAEKFQWSLQGLGMLRLYLPGDARLHVWDTRFAFPGASPVHDHLQWGLTSTILSGRLTNYRYREGSGEEFHWARFKAGYNAKQLHAPETTLLERQPAEIYRPGDSYSQAPNEIHETQADWGTVTLMQKRPTADGETARIFWPAGTVWGSAEPRAATPEEVKAITNYALAHFQPLPEPPAP